MRVKSGVGAFLTLAILLLSVLVLKDSPLSPKPSQSVQGVETEAQTKEGTLSVISVTDGDTVVLSDQQKVRLIGVNTPETNQPFFAEAKQKLESLVLGKEVRLEYDVTRTDSYNRTLAYLYSGDTFINKELLSSGVAVIETIPPNVMHVEQFLEAQAGAKTNCVGLWEGLCNQKTTACIQISSINADPVGNDNNVLNNEWIEFTNTCAESQNLSGFLLKDSSASYSYRFKDVVLIRRQKIKLHSGCGDDTKSDLYWTCPEQRSGIWNNTGDHAFLFDKTGRLVSEMGY